MKHILIVAILFFTSTSSIMAQDDEEPVEEKPYRITLQDRFLISLTTSTFTDLLVSPIRFHQTSTGNTDAQGNPIYADVPFQSSQYNIVSFGVEPRFNIKEFGDNNALTIAAPVSFGVGVTQAAENRTVRGTEGFGSLQIPFILKICTGYGSTYRALKEFGVNVGAGFEINKIGLINTSGSSSNFNKAFVLPCITAGILFMRGDSPMEVNFKYGFGRMLTQDVNDQGDPLLDNNSVPYQRTARGHTLKLTFVYLMNY